MTQFLFIIKSSIVPLFVVLAIAAFYEKKFRPDVSAMNEITLKLLCPVLIFKQVTDSGLGFAKLAPMMMYMVAFTAAMAILGTLCAKLVKMPENKSIPFVSNAALMNFGNMGMPLILFTYGAESSTAAVLVWVVFNIPLSTYGLWLADSDKSIKRVLRNIVKIPMFPAFVLAVILNEVGFSLPDTFGKPLDFLGAATIPLMTLIYGFQIVHIKIRKDMVPLLTSCVVLRLMVSPFIAYFLTRIFHFTPLASKVVMVMMSTPMAASPIMYAMVFKRDYELTTAIVLVTTVVSAITLPIVILAADYLF